MTNSDDIRYMTRALELAAFGRGTTNPNPMVGAVVVKDGRIVGEGFHAAAGGPHAERDALHRAGARARGATLYVNLEPCAHQGRTPPCTEAVLQAGITCVHASIEDPHELVAGRGFEMLRKAGVDVTTGLLEKEARRLNEHFLLFTTQKRPFVTLKMALSLDGKSADSSGCSQWITGEESRRRVHEMRFAHDALLTGIGTVQADNPRLTIRLDGTVSKHLVRVILDSNLALSENARLFDTLKQGNIWVITSDKNADAPKRKTLEARGASVREVPAKDGHLDLKTVLKLLAKENLTSVMVEGGARVSASFVEKGLADKLVVFYAPICLGHTGRSALEEAQAWGLDKAPRFLIESLERLDSDFMVTAYPKRKEKKSYSE